MPATTSSTSSDDAIRRKLLADGDGLGEERRILNIGRMIFKWAAETDDIESSQADAQLKRIENALSQCDNSMLKCSLVYNACKKELLGYDTLSQEIEERITEACQNIADCEKDLDQAKQIRKHRQEYDALANVIQKHPERKDTLKKLENVKRDIRELELRERELERKLDLRKKQFHVLMLSLMELRTILDEDKQDTSACTSERRSNTPMDTN